MGNLSGQEEMDKDENIEFNVNENESKEAKEEGNVW